MGDGGASVPPSKSRTPVQSAFLACERRLKGFVRRLCGDNDVDDIAHEALVSALQAEAGRAIEHPEAYLYRAARNLALRSRQKKSRDIAGLVESAADTVASLEPSVEDQVVDRERFAIFCEAVATLPPSCRRVFVMRKVYGYTHKEIAERLGISTSTVEKHLATGFARCLAAMRAREDDGQGEVADADRSRARIVKRDR